MQEEPGVYGTLIRHFWRQFFDGESIALHGDPSANVVQALGLLAVPGAFFVIICQPLSMTRWNLVAVRYFFVSFSMLVMAFLMIIEWDALFPDRRDFQFFGALPVRMHTVFVAKLAAIAALLGVFLIDINLFATILWPGIDKAEGTLNILAAHIVATATAGLFGALFVAATAGLLVTLLSPCWYRRLTILVRTFLIVLVTTLFFLTPMLAVGLPRFVKQGASWIYWFPGYWFIGFYERLRPAEGHIALYRLGDRALGVLAVTAAVFVLSYLPLYKRHIRKVNEAESLRPRGRRAIGKRLSALVDCLLLRTPTERAVFHFISQTITRSAKHRMFLATYGGFGIALAIMNFAPGGNGVRELPLTLSFVLISGLRAAFNVPAQFRANWIFRTQGMTSLRECAVGMRKWIAACAILPLFAVLAWVEFVSFRWPAALFHLAFGLMLSLLLTDILFLGFRKIPFTCAYFPGKVNLAGLALIYLVGFTLYSRAMAAMERMLEGNSAWIAVFFVVTAGMHISLRWTAARLTREAPTVDYEDAGDPTIRTLDLEVPSDHLVEEATSR